MHKQTWQLSDIRLIPSIVLFIGGAILSSNYGKVHYGSIEHKFIAVIGVLLFLIFATATLHILTTAIYNFIAANDLGPGRAAAIRFVIRVFGYIAILLVTLGLLDIPVGRILLGSAAIGIILGVAAQQALANFFASIVLIISHPFSIGEHITLNSGALGGQYKGEVIDIGLTHTKLKEANGAVIFLPNATVLSSAAINAHEPADPPKH